MESINPGYSIISKKTSRKISDPPILLKAVTGDCPRYYKKSFLLSLKDKKLSYWIDSKKISRTSDGKRLNLSLYKGEKVAL